MNVLFFSINLAVKLIQNSLHLNGTLNFLICTNSLSSFHLLRNVSEKLVVEVQSILYRFCDIESCEIYFLYVSRHSGVLGNERADQLAKEVTGFWYRSSCVCTVVSFSMAWSCFGLVLWIFGLFKGFVEEKIFFQQFFNDSNARHSLLTASYTRL